MKRLQIVLVKIDQYDQYQTMDWIGAEAACEQLGVRPQTLYAYVSREGLEVRADPDDPRRSLYLAAQIAELSARKSRSRKAADVAQGAISWGEPVLDSAVTTIVAGRLYYRGRDAVDLADDHSLEAVARLLRGGHGVALKRGARPPPPAGGDVRARLFGVLAARAGADASMLGRHPIALAMDASSLLDVVADAVAGGVADGPIHQRLAAAWGTDRADLLRRALVLLADHELNASTFAARVAASTGASLAASLLAGLATLSGPRHGGASLALQRFAAEAAQIGPPAAIAARLSEDRTPPGFGHPLYPEGDPRAVDLLSQVELTPAMAELRRAVETITGAPPNVDFALAAMAETLKLPPEAPFALFAVGRAAGWIAHAVEQVQTGGLIRPRARYVGPSPEPNE